MAYEGETVARVAGDTFAVVVRNVAGPEALAARAREMLNAIRSPIVVAGALTPVAASAGAALPGTQDAVSWLQAGEAALAAAKLHIDMPVHVAVHGAADGTDRARLVEDLQHGLVGDEFVVHYQPVVSLAAGRIVGAEALVRWEHPSRGLLPPGAFIAAAEDCGLIVPLGRKVLALARAEAARWAHFGTTEMPFRVAVNLSAKELVAPGAVGRVRAALTDAQADAANLMIEITETAIMADIDATGRILSELRALGVGVAADDFGTGYSSFSHLKRLPVTALKIDRSFVAGLGIDHDDAAIVPSMISLSRAIGIEAITEGIETDEQRDALLSSGCEIGQGYLWAPALEPPRAFEVWASAHRARRAAQGPESRAAQPLRALRAGPEAAIARIDVLHAQGASPASIAIALNREGVPNPNGRRWHAGSVEGMLPDSPAAV